MAWRIHQHVVRGEIDNRARGQVSGRIWIAGIKEPLALDLRGDCQPDLAGCRLRFENPNPVAMETPPLPIQQRGTAGEITAARKARVFEGPAEDALSAVQAGERPREHLANVLYLEWFTKLSGRVVIESAEYRLEISEPAWRFSPGELREREAAGDRSDVFAIEIHADGTEEEWDEFRCEQFLRESDARTERYGQLLKKYAFHPDSERLIAREMGWKWVEEALDAEAAASDSGASAFADERASSEENYMDDPIEPEPDPAREGIDWVRDEDGEIVHPIEKRAHDALHGLLDELKTLGLFPECDETALADFVGHFMNLTAKLAGALGHIARGWGDVEPGMTIAHLKRILAIHNQAMAAADAVASAALLDPARMAHHRSALFGLREEILALIARLRDAE